MPAFNSDRMEEAAKWLLRYDGKTVRGVGYCAVRRDPENEALLHVLFDGMPGEDEGGNATIEVVQNDDTGTVTFQARTVLGKPASLMLWSDENRPSQILFGAGTTVAQMRREARGERALKFR